MKRNTVIALSGVGLSILVGTAVGYFVVTPSVQVSNYKKAAEASHLVVNEKMAKVYDSFKRDAFTKTDQPNSDKADIKVGLDAVKAAESSLDENAQTLTRFRALPLLD